MLKALQNLFGLSSLRSTRHFTRAAVTPPAAAAPQLTQPTLVHYPYFVSRNTQGNLPVYTDIRNGGTRYLILIRNIDGDTNILAKDLANTLFQQNSPEATRMKIQIIRSKNLVITGGRWKNNVIGWLKERGF